MLVISLVTAQKNLFSKDSGIYVPGIHFDSTNPHWTGNYYYHDDSEEKTVHIEYFERNGRLAFSQNVGLRIHSGGIRVAAQK
jgi:hypothetical protein